MEKCTNPFKSASRLQCKNRPLCCVSSPAANPQDGQHSESEEGGRELLVCVHRSSQSRHGLLMEENQQVHAQVSAEGVLYTGQGVKGQMYRSRGEVY